MSKSKNKKYTITSIQQFNAAKTKYNGFTGYGVHGDVKYNRNKEKQKFYKELW